MYLQSKIDGDAMGAVALIARPQGPGFQPDEIEQADCLEVWKTSLMCARPLTRYDLKQRGVVIASVVLAQ